jgi:hypothetical protein
MRQRILRRLEVLEKGHRSREERELGSLRTALVYIWQVVLGYYLGDLEPDERYPSDAEWRALMFASEDDWYATFSKAEKKDKEAILEMEERYNDAYRRLFAKVGLDFDDTPRHVLFSALVTMVNQLPDQWLKWLRSNLQQWAPYAEIAIGSNLPRRLSGDNAFP